MEGKTCWYKDDKDKWRPGRLLHWGCDYEECLDGVGTFTVLFVLDDETQCVDMVCPKGAICFASIPPGGAP